MFKDSYFSRLLIVLLLIVLFCFGFSFLPEEFGEYKVRKVDLLSQLRPDPILQPEVLQIDTIDEFFAMTDTLQNDSIRMNDSIMRQQNYFSLRDSLYKTLYVEDQIDSVRSKIEDYTLGRIALSNFFDALNKRDTLDRPVRIAFLGDSFIEGDILVGDFRQILQQEFGGRGVGFVPVNSVAAQFRPTVQQKAKGWKTRSMLTDKCAEYTLSGLIFEAEGDKSVLSIKAGTRYDNLQPVSSLKFFYESESEIEMFLTCNDGKDTIQSPLKPSDNLDVFEYNGEIRTADFALTNTVGLKALGIAMEDDRGVIVDNFSLRGNSGLILDRLNPESCRDFNRLRQYDLIILQYGLNILDDSVTQYGWYAKRMTSNIEHIKACFPQADILLLGVSDRSRQRDGQFETMPAVSALLSAQRQIAQKSGVAFWNVFEAMGGRNSMVRYVANNWASKDYTHLSFRGGKELAQSLAEALLTEKEFYDTAQEMVY